MAETTAGQEFDAYSNCDHQLEDGAEGRIRAGDVGIHAAWNFHGRIRFENGVFVEEIKQYHKVVGTRTAANLRDLIRAVNDEFGQN